MFKPCEICVTVDWSFIYEGPIRAGAFGTRTEGRRVTLCGGCGVARLDESVSISALAYESDDYRSILEQAHADEDFFRQQDWIRFKICRLLAPVP